MDKKDLCFTAFLTAIATVLSLFPLFAIQWLFDHIFDDADHSLLWLIALGLIATALSTAFFLYLRHLMLLRFAGGFGFRFQTAFWQWLFQLPQNRLFFKIKEQLHSIEMAKEHLLEFGPKILSSVFFSLVYLAAMAFFSFPMTLIALGVIGIDLVIYCSLIRKKKDLKKRIFFQQEMRSGLLTQSLCVLERIRASNGEEGVYKRWKDQSLAINALKEKIEALCSLLITLQGFVPLCILVLLLVALDCGWVVSSRGSFFAFYLAMIHLCIGLREGIGAVVFAPSLQNKLTVSSFNGEKISFKGSIAAQAVADEFGNKISFKLLPGEKICMSASSDLWTTRLVRYLLGLEKPVKGTIYFDGKEQHLLDLCHLRNQVGTVFRAEGVFAGTIWDNLVVGRNCSEQDVEEALHLSGFDEDLKDFRMGYDTLLSEGGAALSTGQKQRLLLSRALCARPALLIIDQGIDALDPLSRSSVLERLKGLSCTQILISHKPMKQSFMD